MSRKTKSTERKTIDAGLPTTLSERVKVVMETYEDYREFYQGETTKYSLCYQILVIVTLSGSALTPILLLSKALSSHPVWQAIPGAIGALAAAINAAFRYRQEWAQAYFTLSALKNEYERFRARTQPDYGGRNTTEESALNAFQDRISFLVMSEVAAWRNETFNNEPARGPKPEGTQSG